MKRIVVLLFAVFLAVLPTVAQQAPIPSGQPGGPPLPPPVTPLSPEFARAADEVLDEVSKIIALPVKTPLKKSIRTRDEIRAYLVRELHEDRDAAKRYADQRTLEKFGLIPKGFDLDAFLIEFLTDQVAGLYDPKGKEFFLADWIDIGEQKIVMAHELVHALQDQHFQLDPWLKAARPNDDAVMARDAVVEGSAIAGMFDYLLREKKLSVRDLPDLEQIIRGQLIGEVGDSPRLARAPLFIRDAILFPYLAGTSFTQKVLRSGAGWEDFQKVFEKPPVATQQILHPDLYLAGVTPRPVILPDVRSMLPPGWKKLDENLLGEFGLRGVLKQFLGEERAAKFAPLWAGDRYAILENEKSKELLLVTRLRVESDDAAAQFFGQYSELLELKYSERRDLLRRRNFFSFASGEGGVFLYCAGDQCLTVEGADRRLFDRIVRAMEWPPAPAAPARAPKKTTIAALTFH